MFYHQMCCASYELNTQLETYLNNRSNWINQYFGNCYKFFLVNIQLEDEQWESNALSAIFRVALQVICFHTHPPPSPHTHTHLARYITASDWPIYHLTAVYLDKNLKWTHFNFIPSNVL